MGTVSNSSESNDLAESLSQRVAELLSAPVIITDAHQAVIASSRPEGGNVSLDDIASGDPSSRLAIPVQLDGQKGQVVVGPATTGEVISPRLAQAVVDLLVNETAVVEQLQTQHEVKSKFIRDLLHGNFSNPEVLVRQARFLGMDLNPPRAVILINAADYVLMTGDGSRSDVDNALVQRQAQAVIDSVVHFFQLPNDTICGYIGDGEIAVLKASNTKNLTFWADREDCSDDTNSSWANLAALKRAGGALLTRLRNDTGASINVGIGRYHPGLDGLAKSYQDAKVALSLGRRFHGPNHVHCLDELGIVAFVGVSDEQTKVDLAMHLLSPLDHDPEVLETLQTFLTCDCSPSATAKQLAIHRNTLRYRLDKSASLTGLDARRFDDAVLIRLSLLLRTLRSDGGQDKPAPPPAAPVL